MAAPFKVGDRVRAKVDCPNNKLIEGKEYVLSKVTGELCPEGTTCTCADKWELINNISNMKDLKTKFALVFKGEPEKTLIKAGLLNTDESLTTDGQAIFLAWLLKKNKEDFKKEVADLILADEEKK